MTPIPGLLVLVFCLGGLVTSQRLDETGALENEEPNYDETILFDDSPLSAEERKQLSSIIVMGKSHAATAELVLRGGALTDALGAEEESFCANHTALMMAAILGGEMWAVQMVDAIGRQPSALLYDGNFRWLGSWEECLAVEPVAYEEPINKTGHYTPFEPRYCQAKFNFKQLAITRQATVGMCFPSTCSLAEMKAVADALVPFLQLPTGTLSKARSISCQETDQKLSDNAVLVTVVCSLFVAVMLIATAYDLIIVLYLNKPVTNPKPENKKGIGNPLYESTAIDEVERGKLASNSSSSESSGFGESTPLLGGDLGQSATQTNATSHHAADVRKVAPVEIRDKVVEEKVYLYKPGILGRLLLSFSMYTNGSKILDTKQSPGTLTAVNGIRFLSMSWVILGHVTSFKGQAPDNYNRWVSEVIKNWPFQAIANATVSVDTFFVLSGLLVGFLTLKEMKRKGGPKKLNWVLFYFHRFWRLTPPYMLVIMLYVTLMKYWGNGPIWNNGGIREDECKYWWHNLLYINNLVDMKKYGMCMGWSWYLANDMQFYVISPLLLIPLFYSKIAGSLICLALILSDLIATGVISKDHNFSATPKVDGPTQRGGESSFETIYIKPYTRVGPYVIGLLLGYILYRTNCKVRLNKLAVLLGWAAATAIGLLVVYGPFTEDGTYQMSESESAFYNAANRVGWGLAVAWLIFACATGYGGPVNKLLSWPGLIPLSRLTYCAYLVHPVVMMTYYYSVRALQHWYDLDFAYQFLANLTVSMATAFVVSLAFESPMMGLEKVLLGRFKK